MNRPTAVLGKTITIENKEYLGVPFSRGGRREACYNCDASRHHDNVCGHVTCPSDLMLQRVTVSPNGGDV